MSEDHDNDNTGVVKRLMPRLAGFATGLGLDVATTREIIERVVADMPGQPDEDRLIVASA